MALSSALHLDVAVLLDVQAAEILAKEGINTEVNPLTLTRRDNSHVFRVCFFLGFIRKCEVGPVSFLNGGYACCYFFIGHKFALY